MEWLAQQSLIFYMAGMTALSIAGWVTWSLAASRGGAHSRDVVSFFKREYESVFFSRDMLVALFEEDFSGAAVVIKSGKGSRIVARLRYLPRAADSNTVHFEAGGQTQLLKIDSGFSASINMRLGEGEYACEYAFPAGQNGKGVFSVNKNEEWQTESARRQIVSEGSYPVLQNGQIVGYVYSESNILGHYAVVLLLKSELPEPVKALLLALEARRFGFAAGGRG